MDDTNTKTGSAARVRSDVLRKAATRLLTMAVCATAGTTLRLGSDLQGFDASLSDLHPRDAATLGFETEGRVSGQAGTSGEWGMAATTPHFQVLDETQDEVLHDPGTTDSVLWNGTLHRLQLGTGVSLGQLGLVHGDWDLAAGASVVEQTLETVPGSVAAEEPAHGTLVEPSLALRLGDWRWTAAWRDQDEAVLSVARTRMDIDLDWGAALGIPTVSGGEVTALASLRKGFSDAFAFEVAGSTSYRRRPDEAGGQSFQRQSLGLQVGTSLRLRPWVAGRDPEWLRSFVDPFQGTALARWSYDWELGVQTRWEAVDADTRTSVTLSRWF
jgi:hypothetical protein